MCLKARTFLFALLFISLPWGAIADQQPTSLCRTSGPLDRITCPHKTLEIEGRFIDRRVKYALPKGKVPRGGWPAVVIYQGSFFKVEFSRPKGMPFGGYNEIRLIEKLLNSGFAVIAPPALERVAWLTNIIGVEYENSEDHVFIQNLLSAIEEGRFGRINSQKLFATGISSGGYNTSRMAVTFPGAFKALAIHSASYADCGGPMCYVPEQLPAEHPPTIFLHGRIDPVVPVSTMQEYQFRLQDFGIDTQVVVSPLDGHEWLKEAPDVITEWFIKYKK